MEVKKRGILTGLAEKMKENKRLELIVYAVIAILVILLYFSSTSDGDSYGDLDPVTLGSANASLDATEIRLAQVLEQIRGAGEVDVMITYETMYEDDETLGVRGVLIVAEGAGDMMVRVDLQRAAQTVLNVDASAVEVFEAEYAEYVE